MIYLFLADLVLILHFTFILFVILGAVLVLRWKRLAWIHIPCAVWGAWIEFQGSICPLTPLENRLRRLGGEAGYNIAVYGLIYWRRWRRTRTRSRRGDE